tara:strand:+ start:289 stop:423 length:135 start_codon:yes stop_codon:yes gene_type:complete
MSSAMTNKMFGKSLLGVLDGSEVFVDCFSQELKKKIISIIKIVG